MGLSVLPSCYGQLAFFCLCGSAVPRSWGCLHRELSVPSGDGFGLCSAQNWCCGPGAPRQGCGQEHHYWAIAKLEGDYCWILQFPLSSMIGCRSGFFFICICLNGKLYPSFWANGGVAITSSDAPVNPSAVCSRGTAIRVQAVPVSFWCVSLTAPFCSSTVQMTSESQGVTVKNHAAKNSKQAIEVLAVGSSSSQTFLPVSSGPGVLLWKECQPLEQACCFSG